MDTRVYKKWIYAAEGIKIDEEPPVYDDDFYVDDDETPAPFDEAESPGD